MTQGGPPMSEQKEREREELLRLAAKSNAVAERMEACLGEMQSVLDEAWEWYEGTRDETEAALGETQR
jgi:hypothetical protein